MPLPVSHSLAGATVYAALDEQGGRRGWRRLLLAIFLANAPDLDFIPGIVLGDPNRFHHGPTHSLLTAVAVGLAAGLLAGRRLAWPTVPALRRRALGTALVVTLCWGSHVVLDALTHDPSPPTGVPMFWPLSQQRVTLATLFPRAEKLSGEASPERFVASIVLSPHNWRALAFEAAVMVPILLVVWSWRRRRRAGAGLS